MGSYIYLGIEKLEIDWGKNYSFTDHSHLFQVNDLRLIPYYYADDEVVMKEGYARSLSLVKHRLDLLGYTLENLPTHFADFKNETLRFGCSDNEMMKYDVFYKAVYNIIIPCADSRYEQEGEEMYPSNYDFGEYVQKCIMKDLDIDIPKDLDLEERWALRSICEFIENIDPYITLRIIAENPKNSNCEVQWRFADVIDGGYVDKDCIIKPLEKHRRILIVTEGKTDSMILERVINELYPNISDFFYFIDMHDNYPFTGVGNLLNFYKGLAKIDIQNKVMFIFDNDTAGVEIYNETQKLDSPPNLGACCLPSHADFENFRTKGTEGESCSDINGKAVTIECFLDLQNQKPYIRWRSYSEKMQQYQGQICPKDDIINCFRKSNLTNGEYNVDKLKYLVDHIVAEISKQVIALNEVK